MEEKDQPTGPPAAADETGNGLDHVPAPVEAHLEPVSPAELTVSPDALDTGAEDKPKPARRRPRRKKETAEVLLTPEPLGATEGDEPIAELLTAGNSLAAPDLPAVLAPEKEPEPAVDPLAAQFGREELETAPTSVVAEIPAEELLLSLAEREVAELGEPVPLNRREPGPRRRKPEPALFEMAATPPADEVVVPEALLEAAPAGFLDFVPERGRSAASDSALLPPITTEILAEVRGVTPEEVERQQAELAQSRKQDSPPVPQRGGQRPPQGPRGGERPPQPQRPAPPPAPGPDALLVVVPEALLETVPEDWLEEEEEAQESFMAGEGRGRRRRKRGRDRDRKPQEEGTAVAEEAPAVAPPPVRQPQIQKLTRAEDEPAGGDRRAERGDRGGDRTEPKTEREYKEILINVDERETRIAVLENGRLVELHVEREERVVGSVYKGRVCNVLPGMDAAFVDIGLERNAFLYVGDILFEDTRSGSKSDSRGDGEGPSRRTSRDVRIADIAKPGQEMLVQVVKGPRGTKGARVSTKMSIPGRYLVLMPEGDHLGVSRKVEDPKERERLRRLGEQMQPKGFGLIIRTEAEGRTEQELRADLDYLVKTWNNISEKNKRTHAPASIHKDLGPILKTIRDLFGQDVDRLVIDNREEFDKVTETLQELAPDLVDRVFHYDEPQPLFSRYNVEDEIDRLLRRKVWLRNGAYLLLDTTEALTTIDVNTGKFVGTSSLAETILKTNLDAVDEIARQLRLRDIGGMIVLDFIDMASSRDRQLVMRALENAFKKDRTRIKIAHISPLGLVEMTRKRTSEAVTDVMSQVCPYCQGRGRVWSPETLAISIERQIRQLCASTDVDAILVSAHPEVASWLVGPEGESVEQMERMLRRPIYIRARHDFHIEKYEIQPGDMMEMEREMMPFHGGQVVDCQIAKLELITAPRSAGWADGYFIDVANAARYQGQTIRVRLTDVRRSFALGEPVAPSTAVDRSEPI